MHDRRRHRALSTIVTIRDAQRDVARHMLFLASEREREAEAASRRANEETHAAITAWEDHLGTGFNPELATALAGQLIGRIEAGKAADEHAARMTGEREESEAEWRLGDARCRQAGEALDKSRRAGMRDREEHALEALADRTSFAWSRA